MKKLILFAALCAIAGNSFGMDQQYMVPCQQNKPTASALILAGIGCVGMSMWYASQKDISRQFVIGDTVTISGGIVNTGSMNLSPRTIGAIAPLIPAVFCFWYGFKNLNG